MVDDQDLVDFEDASADLIEVEGGDPQPAGDDPAESMTVGELEDLLDELILGVEEAKAVPLSGNVMVGREETVAILNRIKALLPEEMRTARWMVREREAFIARTNERSRQLMERARVKANELVSESNILAEAVEEANVLVRNAEGESRRIRLEAEDWSDKQLEQLDILFVNLLKQIRGSRAELRSTRDPEPEPPGD